MTAVAGGLLWMPGSAPADVWNLGPNSLYEHISGVGVELANGEVFVAGGLNGTVDDHGELLSADGTAFNPAGAMTQGRFFAAAALLKTGKVLVAGGDSSTVDLSPASASAELWSPAGGGGSFTSTGSMHVARQVFTLTTLPDGQALAVGGSPIYKTSGPSAGSKTAELYSPATGKWTLTGSMPSGRLGHTATLMPNCKVLIVGDSPAAVTYNYATGIFSPAGSEGNFQRSYQTATLLPNGKVLIAGGETAAGTQLNTASVYNPATGKFTPTANTMSAAHSQGFGDLLSDGTALVGGGFNATGGVSDVDIYHPATNSWASTTSLPANSFAYSVDSATLQNGDVAVIGAGTSAEASEIFTPTATGTVSPPAQNCSGLFSIISLTSATRGKLTVKVGVPSGGSIQETATVPVQSGVTRAILYGTASASPTHWGRVTLTITPRAAAASALQSKGSLRVNMTATFTPPHGIGVHRNRSVTARWS